MPNPLLPPPPKNFKPRFSSQKSHLVNFKGDPKSYFTHSSCVIILLFSYGFTKPCFSTYPFGNLVFRLCFLTYVQHIRCFVILFSLYKNYLYKQISYKKKFNLQPIKNILPETFWVFKKNLINKNLHSQIWKSVKKVITK